MPELQDHHLTSQISGNAMTRGLGGHHAEPTQPTQLTHSSAAPANRNQAMYGSLSSFSLQSSVLHRSLNPFKSKRVFMTA
jgi:hypothetical protein